MNRRGDLFIPFTLILSLLSLLLGAMGGNYIGRKNQVLSKTSPLDVYTMPLPYTPPVPPAELPTQK
jgi:hypothetical protein